MRITVVGDVLLDEDIEGAVERLCPDAPVPVIEVTARRSRAGGAGLVATMLRLDGHDVELVTVLSTDEASGRIRELLDGVRIVAGESEGPTPVKTRVRSASQAVCRFDEGCGPPPPFRTGLDMLDAIERAEALVVADYGRGLTSDPEVRSALERRAERVPLVWDPHPRGSDPVPSARLVTPNLAEASALVARPGGEADPDAAAFAAAQLRERYDCAGVLVTLGSRGAVLQERGEAAVAIPTLPVDTGDPCGAGDRLAATAAAALGSGAGIREAAHAAVRSARDYLAGGGVSNLSPEAARAPDADDPVALARNVRARGGTVVAAGGCFDLLHAGHVRTLAAAKELGDCLIVCMNSDESVRRLKGADRPIIGEHDRAEMLRALDCVDAVAVFSEDDPERIIERLRPDFWVKGGDYTPDSLPEARLLEQWGGRVVTLPFHLGRSTTRLAAALERVG